VGRWLCLIVPLDVSSRLMHTRDMNTTRALTATDIVNILKDAGVYAWETGDGRSVICAGGSVSIQDASTESVTAAAATFLRNDYRSGNFPAPKRARRRR
jgi:hypothetical protein